MDFIAQRLVAIVALLFIIVQYIVLFYRLKRLEKQINQNTAEIQHLQPESD